MKKIVRVLAVFSVLAMMGGGEIALADDNGLKAKTVPFLLKLDAGDVVTIATNGNLEVFARCSDNGFSRRIEVVATSSDEFAGPFNFGTLNPPGSERLILDANASNLAFGNVIDSGTAVQDGSHYIGIDAESTAIGLDIFGFDCFAAGTAVLIQERVDDDDDD